MVQLLQVLQHVEADFQCADVDRPIKAVYAQWHDGAHAQALLIAHQACGRGGLAQAVEQHGPLRCGAVAKPLRLVHPQQHLGSRGKMHIQAKRACALQAAPAWGKAGVELVANGVKALYVGLLTALQCIGLAHQFDQPGVGGDGLGEQLRLLLQLLLAVAQGQALQLMLLGNLQGPQGLLLV